MCLVDPSAPQWQSPLMVEDGLTAGLQLLAAASS